MVLTVFAGIAEFERALIHERTGTGRAAARQRGVRFGHPAKLAADQIALARRLLEEGTAAGEVARMFKVHRATLHRALNALLPEAGSAARAAVPGPQADPDLLPCLQNRQQTGPKRATVASIGPAGPNKQASKETSTPRSFRREPGTLRGAILRNMV
jgi:Helix-turn-helix domain of resolvase/Resolvase, N terminal domain